MTEPVSEKTKYGCEARDMRWDRNVERWQLQLRDGTWHEVISLGFAERQSYDGDIDRRYVVKAPNGKLFVLCD